jgi:tetratricopeptide (TPR) repeat protein
MMNEASPGLIVTFYSYKGGTGRTMALANTAWILASNGRRVLVVDWDLESPGLHKFFHPFLDPGIIAATPGVIEMIIEYQWAATREEPRPGDWHVNYAQVLPHAVSLDWTFPDGGALDFISAGRQNRDYSSAVSSFDWDNFYDRLGGGQFFDALRADMKRQYDYTLIDSRTGLSDIADICTVQLPDILVDCFTLSEQSMEGAAAIARHIDERYHDRNIRILPVPMRIDDGEKEKLDAGRVSARTRFDRFPNGLDKEMASRYWGAVEIPYKAFYAFEETLATFGDEPGSPSSLLAAFERLTSAVTNGEVGSFPPLEEEVRLRHLRAFTRRQPAGPSEVVLSYVPEDRMWADWIESVLTRAGFRVALAGAAGSPDRLGTNAAPEARARYGHTADSAVRTVAVLSAAYLRSPTALDVWSSAPGADTAGPARRLTYVRVGDVRPTGYADQNPVDLTHLDEARAAEALLRGMGQPAQGLEHPADPSPAGPRFPGAAPLIWSAPTRNAAFTGRNAILEKLRDQLVGGSTAVVLPQALYGLGGVGKTQVALEYAHRFMADYDLVWWVSADQIELVNPALAELARRLGIPVGDNVAEAAQAARDELRRGGRFPRWLLVFDNAGDPKDLEPYIPGGMGHVLITSRNQAWSRVADPLEVDVFTRAESIEHLLRRVRGLDRDDAEKVAVALGDLPLAIEQAGAWLEETGMPAATYAVQLETQLPQVLAMNPPPDYPRPVAATWNLSFQQLSSRSPAAARLLQLCAFFAPESISMALLYSDDMIRALVPYDETLREKLVLGRVIREIGRFALMKVDQGNNAVQIHRLVQAVIRSQMTDKQQEDACHDVHKILVGARPRQGGTDDPENWVRYDEIWPHILPSRARECGGVETRQLLIERVRYLRQRGEFDSGLAFGNSLEDAWKGRAGVDASQTLHLRFEIANVLRAQGRFRQARDLDAQTLARQRDALRADHPHILMTAGGLAADLRALGEFDEALERSRETYDSFKDLLGEDHPRTLGAANNLAVSLRLVGDCFAALELDEDTLARRRRVLGQHHPLTLYSAASLARDLREAGEYAESAERLRPVYDQYKQVLGVDSPDTLRTAKSLAVSLRKAGHREEAKRLTDETHGRYLQRYGPTPPDSLACTLELAAGLSALDEKDRARQVATEVRARYAESLGADHPYTLAADNNLVIYMRGTGAAPAGKTLAEHTLSALRRRLGEEHPFTLSCAVNLANCLGDLGEFEAAAALERQTLARLRAKFGPDHPDTLACQANLAVTGRAAGRPVELTSSRDQTLAAMSRKLGADHPTTAAFRDWKRINRDLEPQPT